MYYYPGTTTLGLHANIVYIHELETTLFDAFYSQIVLHTQYNTHAGIIDIQWHSKDE